MMGNVAPLPKLPEVLSDSRGYGVQWTVIFQSFIQIVERWEASGANRWPETSRPPS